MKYLSVCSGIEAASVAWEPLGWSPVAFAEIEPFPSAVLAYHYPNIPNYGDMTKFKEWGIEPGSINLLVGGTPCQSFSVAGLRRGLDDPRGNLMLTYGAIANYFRPTWIVWENVPGVLSSKGGRDFGTFLGMLGQLGYGFAYRVLDAQYFGVAQRRRRVFVVGYLGDWRPAAAVLFESEGLRWDSAPSREAGKVAPTLSSNGAGTSRTGNSRTELDFCVEVAPALTASGRGVERTGETRGQDPVVAVCPTLRAGGNKTGGDRPPGTDVDTADSLIVAHAIQAGATRENPDSGPDGIGVQANLAYTLEARAEVQMVAHSLRGEGFDASEDGTGRGTPIVPVAFPSNLSSTQHVKTEGVAPSMGAKNIATSAVRRLTPRECARLQGFPDDWAKIPWNGRLAEECPDGPQYKAYGNSMAVPVMRWIGKRIKKVDEYLKEGL